MIYFENHRDYKAFKSVVLAGVTDIKYLKSRIKPDNDRKVISPWNIAADFDIDMIDNFKSIVLLRKSKMLILS